MENSEVLMTSTWERFPSERAWILRKHRLNPLHLSLMIYKTRVHGSDLLSLYESASALRCVQVTPGETKRATVNPSE